MCHDYWFDYWVDWRASITMASVDAQVKKLNPDPVVLKRGTFSETLEGETPLGGEMRISYNPKDK